jgi:hypothetical protein
MSEKIIEILNRDEKARKLNKSFLEACERQGLSAQEIIKARETFLMMMIANNPEAMKVMAQELYSELR